MADESGYPRRPYAWTVVAILIATAVLSYTDRQVLSLLVDPIRGELGISDTQVSLLLGTAFAVVYGIAGIPLGFLADRTSRRNLIFAGVVVWSCGTLACGFSHSFGQLFAARIVVGLGEAVLSPAAISLISDYFPPVAPGHGGGFLSQRHRHGHRSRHPDRWRRAARGGELAFWPERRSPASRRLAPGAVADRRAGTAVVTGDTRDPRAGARQRRTRRTPPAAAPTRHGATRRPGAPPPGPA